MKLSNSFAYEDWEEDFFNQMDIGSFHDLQQVTQTSFSLWFTTIIILAYILFTKGTFKLIYFNHFTSPWIPLPWSMFCSRFFSIYRQILKYKSGTSLNRWRNGLCLTGVFLVKWSMDFWTLSTKNWRTSILMTKGLQCLPCRWWTIPIHIVQVFTYVVKSIPKNCQSLISDQFGFASRNRCKKNWQTNVGWWWWLLWSWALIDEFNVNMENGKF